MTFDTHLPGLTLPGTGLYAEPLKARAVEELGEDGAWLLLSIDHYGWRARYDLASALVKGAGPALPEDPHLHRQSYLDLEIQAGLFSAAEQLARLVAACVNHGSGRARLLDAYMGMKSPTDLFKEVSSLRESDLVHIVRVPTSPHELLLSLERLGVRDADNELASAAYDRIFATRAELLLNLSEIAALVERPAISIPGAPASVGNSLRRVDNVFRHGQRVLYHDTSPTDRQFEGVAHGPVDPLSPYAVDLLLSTEEPRYGTVDASPARTQAHVAAIGSLCMRIRQVARGFLISTVLYEPGALLTLLTITLEPDEPQGTESTPGDGSGHET